MTNLLRPVGGEVVLMRPGEFGDPAHSWDLPWSKRSFQLDGTRDFHEFLDSFPRLMKQGKLHRFEYHGRHFFFALEHPEQSDQEPVRIGQRNPEFLWLYRGRVYVTIDRDLAPTDVAALANEASNRRRFQLEKAHVLQTMREQLDGRPQRQAVPQDVKLAVWQRDGGRCIECGSNRDLEFDHVIPVSMGGSNTARNLQLLCADFNRRKGGSLG